jgi:hypothetical protein
MDRKNLDKSLQQFYTACKKEFPVEQCCLVESYPGVAGTPYDVKLLMPDISDAEYKNAYSRLTDIFWATTDAATRDEIFLLCIVTDRGMSCAENRHFQMQFA